MRVAFAGAHRTGKTSLIEALAEHLPDYAAFDEPYRILEDEGHEMSDPPSAEDFERQLRCSIETIETAPARALIDRSPIDFVAYLQAIGEDAELDDAVRDACARLDLVVLVPIEDPDRIPVGDHEDRGLRADVDARVRTLLDDAGIEVLEVSGDLAARVRTVLATFRRTS